MSRAEWYKDLGSFVLCGTGEYPEDSRQKEDKTIRDGLVWHLFEGSDRESADRMQKIFGHRAEGAAPAAENDVTFSTPERA